MIHYQSQYPVCECKVNLFINFLKFSLHQNYTLVFRDIPHISQVIDTLAPLVDKEGRRFQVSWFYPIREQTSFICFIPQVLIKVSICYFFNWFYIIDRNQMGVQVHELNADFFEGSVVQKVPLYSGQGFMRVVISLLNQAQFISLGLIKSRFHTIGFFKSF